MKFNVSYLFGEKRACINNLSGLVLVHSSNNFQNMLTDHENPLYLVTCICIRVTQPYSDQDITIVSVLFQNGSFNYKIVAVF